MGYWKNINAMGGGARRSAGVSKAFASGVPVNIQFAGVDDLMEVMQQMPLKFAKKPMVSVLRKGANEYKKELRRNIPSEMKEMKRVLKAKSGRGSSISISAGFFANVATATTSRGVAFDPYYLLYWSNYGTLSNRSSGHTFQKPRKSISALWRGGIKPRGFVEKSWSDSQNRVEDKINVTLEQEVVKFLNKHKVN